MYFYTCTCIYVRMCLCVCTCRYGCACSIIMDIDRLPLLLSLLMLPSIRASWSVSSAHVLCIYFKNHRVSRSSSRPRPARAGLLLYMPEPDGVGLHEVTPWRCLKSKVCSPNLGPYPLLSCLGGIRGMGPCLKDCRLGAQAKGLWRRSRMPGSEKMKLQLS